MAGTKTEIVSARLTPDAKRVLLEIAADAGRSPSALLGVLFSVIDGWPVEARKAVSERLRDASGLATLGKYPCDSAPAREQVYRRGALAQRRLALSLIDALWPDESAYEPNLVNSKSAIPESVE